MTENLWEYAAVQPGQAGPPTVVTLTPQNIAEYAAIAQNPDPRYRPPADGDDAAGRPLVAMPTMALAYAPLLRPEIAAHNGFVALEQSQTARRQTPFAKCQIRWFQPAVAGDTITAIGQVLEKYERRGSKFVTFRVAAENQRGAPVAQYDYTCIFEYAQGQRAAPQENPAAAPQEPPAGATPAPAIPPAALKTFADLQIGDALAALTIAESQEIINRKSDFRLAGAPNPSNIHNDPEFARQNIFGGLVNAGPATMSYVDQMLAQTFPLSAFYNGGQLLMRAITPFRAGDRVTFQGEVTAKGIEGERGIVECRVKGINQRQELVCLADALMAMVA